MKKLRGKEGNKRGGDLGLIGCRALDVSTFEVNLGDGNKAVAEMEAGEKGTSLYSEETRISQERWSGCEEGRPCSV